MSITDQSIDWETELPLHREWMVRTALRRIGDAHASEDVVQDVILGVVRQNPRLDDVSKVRSWLYQVVIRRVADHLRIRYRDVRAVSEIAASENPCEQAESLDWMLASEQHDLLGIAIQRLPDVERQIILLKYTQNWSYKQLAAKLELSERAVEYQLVRAKQKLRHELQRLNGNEDE